MLIILSIARAFLLLSRVREKRVLTAYNLSYRIEVFSTQVCGQSRDAARENSSGTRLLPAGHQAGQECALIAASKMQGFPPPRAR